MMIRGWIAVVAAFSCCASASAQVTPDRMREYQSKHPKSYECAASKQGISMDDAGVIHVVRPCSKDNWQEPMNEDQYKAFLNRPTISVSREPMEKVVVARSKIPQPGYNVTLSDEQAGERGSALRQLGYLDGGAGMTAMDTVPNLRALILDRYKAAMMYYIELNDCRHFLGNPQYSKSSMACMRETAKGFSEYVNALKDPDVSDIVINRCMRDSGFGRTRDFDAWAKCIKSS